jgi:hypothetical protein
MGPPAIEKAFHSLRSFRVFIFSLLLKASFRRVEKTKPSQAK